MELLRITAQQKAQKARIAAEQKAQKARLAVESKAKQADAKVRICSVNRDLYSRSPPGN
jgi:hypothetical protein